MSALYIYRHPAVVPESYLDVVNSDGKLDKSVILKLVSFMLPIDHVVNWKTYKKSEEV